MPMAELKTCFEKAGYTDVSTYINSGNVIFKSTEVDQTKLRIHLEVHIEERFGFTVPVLTRTSEDIQAVAATIPADWENNKEQKSDVLFLWEDYDSPDTIDLIKTTKDVDELRYIEGAILWHVDRSVYNKSGMHDFVGTKVYKHMTARNVNTVRKLDLLLSK